MADTPTKLLNFLSELMPRDDAKQLMRSVVGHELARRDIDRRRRERVGPSRARCEAAFEERFGAVPEGLRADLDAMEPAMLAAVEDLARRCADLQAFQASYAQLRAGFGEGKILGARQVLRGLLRQKFGHVEFVQVEAIDLADALWLDICFGRLLNASSISDVISPLLRALDIEGYEPPGTPTHSSGE